VLRHEREARERFGQHDDALDGQRRHVRVAGVCDCAGVNAVRRRRDLLGLVGGAREVLRELGKIAREQRLEVAHLSARHLEQDDPVVEDDGRVGRALCRLRLRLGEDALRTQVVHRSEKLDHVALQNRSDVQGVAERLS